MSASETRQSAVERVVGRIAKVVVEKPKRVLLAGILFFLALSPGVGRVYQNIKYYIWFEPGDQRIELLDEFEQKFGSDLASVVIVHSPSGIFDKESAALLIELTDKMWKVAETVRVESLSNFSWVHAEGDELIVESLIPDDQELTPELLAERKKAALSHEQLPGFLVSKDGKTAAIYGWLRPTKIGKDKNEYNDFVQNAKELHALIKQYQGKGDHQLYLAGLPATEAYQEVGPPAEMQKLSNVILAMCLVLLFVYFRRLSGMLLPFAVVIPSVLLTLAVAGWSGITINPETITSPNIMVIVAVSSSIHILFTFFRALDRGLVRREAARYALEHALVPTFFSCLTIGIGFLSLITMTIPPLQDLGILVAAGTAIVWLLLFLILGPLMVLLPIKAKKKKKGAAPAATASPADVEEELEKVTPRAQKLTDWVDRHKVGIVAGWAALLGLSIWLAFNNKVSFDPVEWFDPRTDVRKAIDVTRSEFGWSENFEVVIDSGKEEGIKDPEFLGRVDKLDSWLRAQKGVVQAFSLLDILKETNRALYGGDQGHYKLPGTRQEVAEQFLLYTMNLPLGKSLNERVTLANDALRMTVLSRRENSPAVLSLLDDVRAKGKELGLNLEITGRTILTHQVNPEMVPSFFRSMLSGTLVIALVLLVYFRSLRLAFFGLFLELIPLVLGAGIVFFLLGKNFDMATISTFAIVLGVTVDDTVHYLHGYGRERRLGRSPREAISRLWNTTAAGMVISQSILACCFALFVFVVFPIIRYMGIQVAAMLVIALIANLTLSPALLLLLRGKDVEKRDTTGSKKA